VLFSFSDKRNDRYSVHRPQEQRHRYSSGNRPREHGRTFYNRRTQQHASETSTFNTKGQKTLSQDFSNQEVDRNSDHSWQDEQMNGRAHACERFNKNMPFKNDWHERNGYRRNYNARGNRSSASDSHSQQSKTASTDIADCDSDFWPPASTETNSACSSSSLTSDVPLSPNMGEGWYLFYFILSCELFFVFVSFLYCL